MKKKILVADYSIVADIHAIRLQGAIEKIKLLMPLTAAKLATLELDQVAFLDMMITQFGKLQDVLGAKIFPLILDMLGEDAIAFIDKLNKLERLGYIHDVNWWMDLREIRNQVMHDCPDDYELICSHLAVLIIKAEDLLQFWGTLKYKIAALKVAD